MKNFPLADSSDLLVVRLNLASWAQKTFDSYFLDMMYVEFKKNFFSRRFERAIGVRLNSATWAQKRLIPTF